MRAWENGANMIEQTPRNILPNRAGVGLKPEHYGTILETHPDIGFFEVHAENYMGAGGPPHRYLSAIADLYPISIHGVGLSIGGTQPLDKDHLLRLKKLLARYNPGLFSEHLAWSTHDGTFFHDLLPLPYTALTLQHVCEHIDKVQSTLGRQMLLENPSTYVQYAESTYCETEFIREIADRTGCSLLLDVNNVYVASINQHWDPARYIEEFPLVHVREIHLAGYCPELDDKGWPLLIDSHDRPVSKTVWTLFKSVIERIGALPTLIEWDAAVPTWPVLLAEAEMAESALANTTQGEELHAALL